MILVVGLGDPDGDAARSISALFDRAGARAILAAWRSSLFAGFMGALASQFWFIAFALTDAARVRTLALIEVLFAQARLAEAVPRAAVAARLPRHDADRRGRGDPGLVGRLSRGPPSTRGIWILGNSRFCLDFRPSNPFGFAWIFWNFSSESRLFNGLMRP